MNFDRIRQGADQSGLVQKISALLHESHVCSSTADRRHRGAVHEALTQAAE